MMRLRPVLLTAALGVVAYECLAGNRPFDADTPIGIALAHMNNAPPALPKDTPPVVADFVARRKQGIEVIFDTRNGDSAHTPVSCVWFSCQLDPQISFSITNYKLLN